MGHILSARCACGYKVDDVRIGGGRADFSTTCMHPGLCKTGKHLVAVNLKLDPIKCPDGHAGGILLYFRDSVLQQVRGSNEVSSWQGREINDGAYLCPKCATYDLVFSQPHTYFD